MTKELAVYLYKAIWALANPDKVKAKRSRHYKKHRAKILKKQRDSGYATQYYRLNAERINTARRRRAKTNNTKEKHRAANKRHRQRVDVALRNAAYTFYHRAGLRIEHIPKAALVAKAAQIVVKRELRKEIP